jgi:hypothetical protein
LWRAFKGMRMGLDLYQFLFEVYGSDIKCVRLSPHLKKRMCI